MVFYSETKNIMDTEVYFGIIYIWLCTESNKSYIGQTKCSTNIHKRNIINTPEKLLLNRWKGHIQQSKYYPKDYFHLAIRKYGSDKFIGKILQVINTSTIEELIDKTNEAEYNIINEFNTIRPNGYNLKQGGLCPLHHEDTCKKMRIKKQQFINSEEGKQWIKSCSEKQLLYFQTEKGIEQKENHGKYISELYKENPEIINNISNSLKTYFQTPEGQLQIQNQKDWLIEYYKSEKGFEAKNKLKNDAIQRWKNTEYIANQIQKGIERFTGDDGQQRRIKLSILATERLKNKEYRQHLSKKTIEYFDKIGRKNYTCMCCKIKCRDKTEFRNHCNSKKHKKILNEMHIDEQKIIIDDIAVKLK
jgi:hypothetical protein